MGARGPKPAPAALKLVRGETRPSRVNYQEPKPPVPVELPAPSTLTPEGAEVWNRLVPRLMALGVMTDWDVDLMEAFCWAVVHHREANRMIARAGLLSMKRDDKTGTTTFNVNPAIRVARDMAQVMTSIGGRFGLTPSDRSGLIAPEVAAVTNGRMATGSAWD
jgi:P27 family predicted phage terminase small subunit